jgi:hypothetical protein
MRRRYFYNDYDLDARDRLLDRLARLKLRMVEVQGDGNCQFRAVSRQLFGHEGEHAR